MENDLIRRSDVFNQSVRWEEINGIGFVTVAEDDIKAIPAVDAAEVRHGHWVTEEEAIEKDDYSLRDTCSVCGHCDWDCTESQNFNFCPNCGARMDGRREDGDGDV